MEYTKIFTEKALAIFVVLMGLSIGASAQTFSEWFRQKKTRMKYLRLQVAALAELEKVVQDGYRVAEEGVDIVRFIREKEYARHYSFFKGLVEINPVLASNPIMGQYLVYEQLVLTRLELWLEPILDRSRYSQNEAELAVEVMSELSARLSEYGLQMSLMMQPGTYRMEDGPRIRAMTALWVQVEKTYKETFRKMNSFDDAIASRRREESFTDFFKISLQ